MAQRLRVLLLIPHLGGGGAEQVTALLARCLSRDKYEVHLGLVTRSNATCSPLPPWVTVHNLGASRVRSGALRLLRLIRRLKPDVILSGMAHLNFLVLMMRPFFPPSTRVLVRQNGTVSAALADGRVPRYTRLLYRLLYRHADRVICQSRAMAVDLAGELELGAEQIAVLPNPIDFAGILAGIREAKNDPDRWAGPGPHLLAVGRLSQEKGFDLLLQALARVHNSYPQADLLIAGAGAEEAALKAQCSSLELDEAVCFAGHLERPYACFPGATLFVLSSRHEGMPNALLEAVAAGLPIVALPSSGGVEDLLRNRTNAWLATEISADALADSLLSALQVLHPQEQLTHTCT
ncbi:MAG TPA: glycosyltransferase [Terracidiphilus sp.]|nr:glycosyltransferase [Terracidiphilus sp.]